ncbi:signal transduction histidine kinase [Rhodovulum imhoffii]|uniref:histidine kinase n=1 Tax=Rhodovulum imhoffii TaxID=365340 RepID=A0A2T5BQK6_9RHOB|nr:hypothetical protein [Rhodovulum imhoffii]PTN01443.1 signal transduction histidine kinase [Rhodovulum imhoffii]
MVTTAPSGHAGRWWAGRLQRRFAVIFGALLAAMSLGFLLLVTTTYRQRTLETYEDASISVNLLLQAALENAMIKRDLDGLQDIVRRLGSQDGVRAVSILNPKGEIRFSSDAGSLFSQIDDPAFGTALADRHQKTGFRAPAEGVEVLRSINPVLNKPVCQQCHGPVADNPVNGLLVVDYDASAIRRNLRDGVLLLGVSGLFVIALVLGGLWAALHRLVLARTDALATTAATIAGGDLSVRVAQTGQDEIARLAQSFNTMADQVEAQMETLRANATVLQALIDAIPDGVRVIDGNFRVRMVNAAYCAQLGVTSDEALRLPCHGSSHRRGAPCVPTLVCCPLVELLQNGAPRIKCSHTHVTASGATLPVELFAVPVTLRIEGAEIPCVVESIRDLQTQMNISQEQRLSEMGILAAGVAHEVLNPMSSLKLALRSIRKDARSPRAGYYLDIADAEIDKCMDFTESLLRLAALPQGERELIDMNPIIRETLALLRFEAEKANARLVPELEGCPRVLARDGDMRTLVFNLVLNAIHAMPEGGTVKISCRAREGTVRLSIRDTGVGIPPHEIDKIFLPFWTRRADGSRGRGLGLSICKSILDNLNGRISAESAPGDGAVFHVSIPDADEARA